MEHVRCAHCRNPFRGRQASVRHTPSSMAFHTDCWSELHQHAQQDYTRTVAEQDVLALLSPYSRRAVATWLPHPESDEVADVVEVAEVLTLVDAPAAPAAEMARLSESA